MALFFITKLCTKIGESQKDAYYIRQAPCRRAIDCGQMSIVFHGSY